MAAVVAVEAIDGGFGVVAVVGVAADVASLGTAASRFAIILSC